MNAQTKPSQLPMRTTSDWPAAPTKPSINVGHIGMMMPIAMTSSVKGMKMNMTAAWLAVGAGAVGVV